MEQEQIRKREELVKQFLLSIKLQEHKEAFLELLNRLEQEIFQSWQNLPEDKWSELKAEMEVVKKLKGIFNECLLNGAIAKRDLETLDKQSEE